RTLRINGSIPFAEAASLPIEFSNEWQNYTPSDALLQPYLFYLEAGRNSISLAVDLSPYREMVYGIQDALRYVNDTALDIRKLTGNQLDKDRDWDLLDYLPTIDQDLLGIASLLRSFFIKLDAMSLTTKLSEMQSQLRVAIRNLEFLAKEPNQIPKNIALLTTSSSSIAQTLGVIMADLLTSPVTMDRIYIHSNASLPSANASFFQTIWVNIQRFFMSFFDQRYNTVADASELQVWVNRPKLYVDLIQKMVDEEFTPQTGIPVKISVLADEGKLILANSAKRNPDVALGISSWLPYDLGIRGALSELTQFQSQPNFQTTLQNYPAQSLIPMVYNNELYGLPDTENFYILFYRHDILSKLNISVPNTWSDVIKLMPVLRRFGMNFNLPLSSATALKSFDSTLPFFFQYGSKVYADNAFNVDLNNAQSIAALTTMTELYTIYSLDTTVTNFYNDFRLGTSPIGVGDFGMYIRLL
ncbi:MAG: extracellular solute-binding protein, partial [Candidatus Izemoplasmatales bacterium]|nr:extracellular solute-binding protein [Candidatus Izemoplasmatales bacterium]